jgi:hypothetical protein
MVYLKGGDGKTIETSMILTGPKDHIEGRIYLSKIMEYLVQYYEYDDYTMEDVEINSRRYNITTAYLFIKNGKVVDKLYIDTTILFHVCSK